MLKQIVRTIFSTAFPKPRKRDFFSKLQKHTKDYSVDGYITRTSA